MAATGGEHWSSRTGFIMAAIGAAVGLGNIWKFPYVAGTSGGGAFVLLYLGAVFLITLPILIAEIALGRRGHSDPVKAMDMATDEAKASKVWALPGALGVLAGLLISTFYCVIAGWTLYYLWFSVTTGFSGVDETVATATLDALLADPGKIILFQSILIAICVFIVSRGIAGGIEKTVTALIPLLFVLLIVLAIVGATTSGFGPALSFMFAPDFSVIEPRHVLVAVGQAFFSIGVAMGLMMAYGAYLPKTVSIPQASFIVAVADTLVALIAGMAIFPFLFANGLDAGQGPGLVFVAMPLAFSTAPGGAVLGVIFFALLVVAAITSVIALMQGAVSYLEDKFSLSATWSATIVGAVLWLVGLLSVFSTNILSDVYPLGMFAMFEGMTFFDVIDFITQNMMMPIGAILISLFFGWKMPAAAVREEVIFTRQWLYPVWLWALRIPVPVAIIALMIAAF